jgi:heme-degrading monooxygenase HmoA
VSELAAGAVSPGEPVCVVTRITFPSWRSLPGAYRRFRRLRRAGRAIPGLVEAQVRVASGATLLIVSVWEDELALIQFTTLESHVNAVRWTIDKRGEVWSGVFRLTGTSSMSKPWIGTIRHWEPLVAAPAETVAVDEH